MNHLVIKSIVLAASVTFLSAQASADTGDRIENRLDKKGDRIENRLDQRGDGVNNRLDIASERADANGKERFGNRLDRKGDRVDHRLDRKGSRIDHRLDRKGNRVNRRHQVGSRAIRISPVNQRDLDPDRSGHVGYAQEMANPDNLSQFLASVEKRAFGMAVVSVKNADDALDIVQDAMFTLARKYSEKNSSEWAPIFYRVLNNRITDFHRSNSRRAGLFGWFGFGESSGQDELEQVAGPAQHNPEFIQELDSDTRLLLEAVALLPVRQQQAFLLRAWEGMDVKNTAKSMNCSEGSVKTHYSRAVHALRENLGEALQGEDDE